MSSRNVYGPLDGRIFRAHREKLDALSFGEVMAIFEAAEEDDTPNSRRTWVPPRLRKGSRQLRAYNNKAFGLLHLLLPAG